MSNKKTPEYRYVLKGNKLINKETKETIAVVNEDGTEIEIKKGLRLKRSKILNIYRTSKLLQKLNKPELLYEYIKEYKKNNKLFLGTLMIENRFKDIDIILQLHLKKFIFLKNFEPNDFILYPNYKDVGMLHLSLLYFIIKKVIDHSDQFIKEDASSIHPITQLCDTLLQFKDLKIDSKSMNLFQDLKSKKDKNKIDEYIISAIETFIEDN